MYLIYGIIVKYFTLPRRAGATITIANWPGYVAITELHFEQRLVSLASYLVSNHSQIDVWPFTIFVCKFQFEFGSGLKMDQSSISLGQCDIN